MFEEELTELGKVGLDLSDCILSENDRTIGWLCSYVPEEIIHASGFYPMRIRGRGDPIGRADGLLHNNLCPFVRSVMDDAVEGSLEYLSGVVFANSCDAMRRLHDAWSVFLENDMIYSLDPPKGVNGPAIAYYTDQLRDFAKALNRDSPEEINNRSLEQSIEVFNDTRMLMEKVAVLASNNSLSGHTLFNIAQMATRCRREEFNQRLARFLDTYSDEEPVKRGVRILLAGCIIDRPDQVRLVEDVGAHVVANELCSGSRQFDKMVRDDIDPYEALAERYILKAPCARMTNLKDRIDYLVRLAEENNVDGVVYYIVKFCDHYMWDYPNVRVAFQEKGIPVLDVEGDYMKGSFGPLQTRIQAFVESLE